MQIVRDLAGYTLGRSDLLRRAMSKKKGDVMQKERQNFVYGNPEENVPGCIANGIDEKTANQIYDEMIDFAKYAFNKSHAAAYAVVAYQTAWLKYYYPVEFMAALMTSVIDNSGKVSEYITPAADGDRDPAAGHQQRAWETFPWITEGSAMDLPPSRVSGGR